MTVTATIDDRVEDAGVAGQHRRRVRLGRVAIALLALIAVPLATGAVYEAIASISDTSGAPGQMVDVGGYRLHLDCRGEGGSTIVMDAGLGGSSLDWTLVSGPLAATSRVCVYDRAGMGWSDPGASPRSPSHLAEDLYRLLTNAGEPGPYILVGHSLAGKTIRMFAASHSEDVAGLVLVDARSEQLDLAATENDVLSFKAALTGEAAVYSLARRLGLVRLFGADLVNEPRLSRSLATRMALLKTNPTAIETTVQEGLARSDDDGALATATLGSLPLVVIAAGDSMRNIPGWRDAQQTLSALSTAGTLLVADHSGHAVQLEEPDLVIAGVQQVLATARRH